ncbi:MAG: hypothetical protein K6F53_07385 [Lachnospiraceae bacterium]|nr:hypothetical protein [Lachnospiraceae bacterium]
MPDPEKEKVKNREHIEINTRSGDLLEKTGEKLADKNPGQDFPGPVETEEKKERTGNKTDAPRSVFAPVLTAKDKKAILKYEKESGDYTSYGIGFDLDSVNINPSDSSLMKDLKQELKEYLTIRKSIFYDKKLQEKSAEIMVRETEDNTLIADGDRTKRFEINPEERKKFGESYERVCESIRIYLAKRGGLFSSKRGDERAKQVERIRELVNNDNRRFWLSTERRELLNSTDMNSFTENSVFPTWSNVVLNSDLISNRNQAYRDERRKQKEQGTLPGLGRRHKEWWSLAFSNAVPRLKMGLWNAPFGLVDRILGFGTMIAANSLKLAGKIAKAPLKLLSMGVNQIFKCAKSEKRWQVDYSLTKGWTGLDEGRQVFREYARGLISLPVGMWDAVVHGFPYLFNKMRGKETGPVFRKSAQLSSAVRGDIYRTMNRLGFFKQYEEQAMAEIEEGRRYVNGDFDDSEDDEEEEPLTEDNLHSEEEIKEEEVHIEPRKEEIKEEEVHIEPRKEEIREDKKKEPVKDRAILYTKEEKLQREQALDNAGFRIPKDRDDLVKLRTKHYQKKQIVRLKNGKTSTDFTWNDNENPILMENYDWLMQYYRVHDRSLEENRNPAEKIPKLAFRKYDVSMTIPGMDKAYEKQDTNNCYACTGSAMLNQYLAKRSKDQKKKITQTYNQHDFRGYRPAVKEYSGPLADVMLPENYDTFVKEIDDYAGAGKTVTGNIFEMGDFFMDKLKENNITDVSLNRVVMTTPPPGLKTEKSKTMLNNMKAVFADRINDILSGGSVAGVLVIEGAYAHYVTVTGIKGDMLTVYDSYHYGGKPKTVKIGEFLRGGRTIEINWLADITDPKALIGEYPNLTHDEGGFDVKELKNLSRTGDVYHTSGVTVMKEESELGPGMDGISQMCYIPTPGRKIAKRGLDEVLPGALSRIAQRTRGTKSFK